MSFEERFLASGGRNPLHGFTRVRHAQSEEVTGDQLTAESDADLTEVHFGLAPRKMGLRNECRGLGATAFGANLWPPLGDIGPYHRLGDVGHTDHRFEGVELGGSLGTVPAARAMPRPARLARCANRLHGGAAALAQTHRRGNRGGSMRRAQPRWARSAPPSYQAPGVAKTNSAMKATLMKNVASTKLTVMKNGV